MSSNVYQLFQEIETKGHILSNCWQSFYDEIIQHLPESYHPEMEDLSAKLESALAQLIEDLHNPTLTLATTGTTSSGKSTLVNFLCGAEIVPVATSEMSAGVVTIEYSQDKALTISKTEGATWECGYWAQISDQEIYQRLEDAMLSYINNRESSPNVACPNALIRYPFRFVKDLDLDLPRGSKVKVLDLPGLAHVGDEGNAEVIRQCREALCLVTYNSAETDRNKTVELLQEVVQQVKALRGSPARMLFVLNRIDVFRADRSWPSSEERFVERTVKSIKDELTEQLQEYKSDIESLEITKLSSWAALLSIQIKDKDTAASVAASRKIDINFNSLIEEVLQDLPRKHESWSDHDRSRVAESLQERSYAKNFEKVLKEHINNHFPQLVIPQIIERFYVQAGNSMVEWSVQTTNAILNSSQAKYDLECEKIAGIRNSLRKFLDDSDFKLRQPFEKVEKKFEEIFSEKSDEDPVVYLEQVIDSELQSVPPYEEIHEKLFPIYRWERGLGDIIEKSLEPIAQSLKTGQIDLSNIYLQRAKHSDLTLLSSNLKRLIKAGYTGELAKNGGERTAKTKEEKEELKELNEELNNLAIHLSDILAEIVKLFFEEASDRIYTALDELFKFHLAYLEKEANVIAPGLGIKFPESQLIKIQKQPRFTINFNAGFEVTKKEWTDQVVHKERLWYTLFLFKKTRTEYKKREIENAHIPSTTELRKGWFNQAGYERGGFVSRILPWFSEQIELLNKNVSEVQTEIIDRYQNRLDKANQEIILDYELNKSIWGPIHRQALALEQEFKTLKI